MMRRVLTPLFASFARLRRALSGSGLSKLPGLLPLYNALYKTLRPRGIIAIECQGFRLLVNSDDEGLVPYLLTEGIYDPSVTSLFTALVRPGMTVIDAGANVGYFTLIAARCAGNNGRVFAFEPEPSNYDLLVRNIELNQCTNVTAIPLALSDQEGQVSLHLDKVNLGCHSVSKENVSSPGGLRQVEATTLDKFADQLGPDKRVDFIKMDVQGAEGLIIAGGEETLRHSNVKMVMEFWPEGLKHVGTDPAELLRKLQSLGFQIAVIESMGAQLAAEVKLEGILDACKAVGGQNFSLNLLLTKLNNFTHDME